MLVTGAGRGIGAATAILAAQRGYTVCVNYLKNDDAARMVIDAIREKGGTATLYRADVSIESEVVELFSKIDRDHGPIAALVNNAGTLEAQARVDDISGSRVERILKSNVLSCFLCCREAVRRMSTRHGGNGGSIVNVSSVASRTGSPFEYVDYAAAKGAMDSITIGLSKEVADEGIRVNSVRPGFIYTDIHASGGEPGRVDRLKSSVPMKRGGFPEEVAAAIMWLISDEASFTTGAFIEVSGGR